MTVIGIVQMRASVYKEKNLDLILRYIKQAGKAKCNAIVFPEYMMFYVGKRRPAQISAYAEKIDGQFISEISSQAKSSGIDVIGTIYEKSRGDRVYDTAFHIDEYGKMASVYRKTHLYDALGVRESRILRAGSKIQKPAKTSIGNVGLQICYDLRFPEVSRTLAITGANILVAPSAWVQGPNKEDQWVTINKTRAIENGCFVIAPAHLGNIYCGRSLAIDPAGKVLVDMKKRAGMTKVKIDRALVNKVRKQMPLLSSRRENIYF